MKTTQLSIQKLGVVLYGYPLCLLAIFPSRLFLSCQLGGLIFQIIFVILATALSSCPLSYPDGHVCARIPRSRDTPTTYPNYADSANYANYTQRGYSYSCQQTILTHLIQTPGPVRL
ncbi:hypothetical protein P171DRAFT_227589 [Karstenula rhodostoma CBS 690.94]|uniref:Uncharacterized protein n=1 Tax=Karstenula rhodostoma CBS 690.94 TaxID=1392251 RepID=A0A9P4PQT1_9PLEO|nr:hypothetical protein P171DRAFT_227589 [Karstenula rhodostoma CBS 690.94]